MIRRFGIAAVAVFAIAGQGRAAGDVVIETEAFRLTVGTNACAKSLVVKATGEECLNGHESVSLFAATQKRPFNNEVKLIHQHKRTTYPANRLRREGDRLIVGFEIAAYEAEVRVCATNGYAVFELVRLISNRTDERHYRGLTMDVPPVESFRILQLPVRDRRHFGEWLNVSWDDKAAVAVVAAEPLAEVDHERRGGHRLMRVDLAKGRDLIGGKAAIVVGVGREPFLDAMDAFERDLGLPRGVASRRNPRLTASIFWTADLWPENVDRQIALAKRGGFRMMLIYYPSFLAGDEDYFRFGNYDWNEHYPNGETDVRKVLDKIRAAGITPGFHTLQTYIGLKSRYVTPVADPRLSLTRHFTLARPVPQVGEVTDLFVHENPLDAPKCEKTRILKFGGELFSYDAYSTEPPYRFVGVKRGLFETRAATHPAGEIGGVLDVSEYNVESCYIDQNTDLQDEIAVKIARICDQGMEFCYFDGSEGVNPPCGINVPYSQYRVVRTFKRPPLFLEGAAKGHFGWHLLAGGNAFDVFTPEEFKAKIADYPLKEAPLMQNDFTRVDFGWWKHLKPGECSWRDGSVSIGTQPDMWEYGTSKAAAWDCPATIQFRPDFLEHPRAEDLLEVMRRWEDVRAKRWLTAEQKAMLKDPPKEFHLYRNERGEYELHEIEMLPTPAAAKAIRGFLFERAGKRVIACWHRFGEGTLDWALGPKATLGALRYFETDKTRAQVKSAWSAASLGDLSECPARNAPTTK